MSPLSSDSHLPKLAAGLSVVAVVLVLRIVWLHGSVLAESRAVVALAVVVMCLILGSSFVIEFSLDVSIGRLDPLLENALFRIVQESLANACRHSKSDRVRIELTERNGSARIVVEDWGIGFDPRRLEQRGFGLDGIQERARLFGGHATIQSAPGKGARVVVELPLRTGPVGKTSQGRRERPS